MSHAIWHAVGVFFDRLANLGWGALALGVACHITRLLCVGRAWRNILKASYPSEKVAWRKIVGAVFAGAGVSAIVPARGGDAVRVLLAKRSIERSSYATVAASLILLTAFDFVIAGALVLWAAVAGLLPGLHALGPSFDFRWAVDHTGAVLKVIGVVLAIAVVALLWFAEDLQGFRHRLAQGFAILKDRSNYLRHAAAWQCADWLLRLTAVFFFLHAFGLPATVHNALLVQVSAALASLIPLTPQGIGTEQAFLISIFRGQASAGALLAFSVGMRITLMVVNATLGFATLFLTLRTVRLRGLREHASSS